jgi:outer membrane protein assembly factor BamB
MLWFKDIASATGVQVDRTNLAISEKNGDLWMLDRRNGSTQWKIDRLTNRGLTRPTFYGNYVVVGDIEGYLHWIDTEIGSFVARVRAGKDGFAAAPLTVGTTMYVLTHDGDLVAYRAGAAI